MSEKRNLDFRSPADVAADVSRLREGHEKCAGTWTFEQMCWHCSRPLGVLKLPVTRTEPTEAELEARKFLDVLLATRRVPEGRPTPPGTDPVAEATPGPEAVDELLAGLEALDAYPHPYVAFTRFGPVPFAQFREFVLIHTSHHLNFFSPRPARRTDLKFATIDDALAEIALLRRGYQKAGNWSLPQMSQHLAELIELAKDEPPIVGPTEKQAAVQKGFLEPLLAGGPMPKGGDNINPPSDATDQQIDRLETAFRKLAAYPHDRITSDPLGPMATDDWRRLHLIHAAHHLGFLVPTASPA